MRQFMTTAATLMLATQLAAQSPPPGFAPWRSAAPFSGFNVGTSGPWALSNYRRIGVYSDTTSPSLWLRLETRGDPSPTGCNFQNLNNSGVVFEFSIPQSEVGSPAMPTNLPLGPSAVAIRIRNGSGGEHPVYWRNLELTLRGSLPSLNLIKAYRVCNPPMSPTALPYDAWGSGFDGTAICPGAPPAGQAVFVFSSPVTLVETTVGASTGVLGSIQTSITGPLPTDPVDQINVALTGVAPSMQTWSWLFASAPTALVTQLQTLNLYIDISSALRVVGPLQIDAQGAASAPIPYTVLPALVGVSLSVTFQWIVGNAAGIGASEAVTVLFTYSC